MPKFTHIRHSWWFNRMLLPLLLLCILMGVYLYKHQSTPQNLRAKVDQILVIKSQRKMMLMKNHRILKVYHVSLGRNPVGKKTRKDDGKTPEGHYVIDWRNPQSRYHLSLHISYPDKVDTLRAWTHGASPGGSIMIHGVPNGREHQEKVFQQNDWTDGCIAVTNKEIDEIWKNVTNGTPIEIRP